MKVIPLYKLEFTVSGPQKYQKIYKIVDSFEQTHPELEFINMEFYMSKESESNLQYNYTLYYQIREGWDMNIKECSPKPIFTPMVSK